MDRIETREPAELGILEEDDACAECGCDFVQIITDGDERIEIHHVIPDDGAPHIEDTTCPCRPDFERLDTTYIVVDHRDQDTL